MESGDIAKQDLRFFVGYAGWSPGQLENEIDAGGWILAESSPDTVFAEEPSTLWRAVLRKMGGQYAVLANFPDDPRMN
jgi:putative transcriptional regulator